MCVCVCVWVCVCVYKGIYVNPSLSDLFYSRFHKLRGKLAFLTLQGAPQTVIAFFIFPMTLSLKAILSIGMFQVLAAECGIFNRGTWHPVP